MVDAEPARDAPADAAMALALRCAAAMWADDQASQRLGMPLISVGPGCSTVTMAVREDMINGHGNCHGGFIAALADSAFAFACNTYGRSPSPQDSTSPSHAGCSR